MENSKLTRTILLVLAGILPTAFLAARLSTGISLSPDSLTYLHAASGLFSEGSLLKLSPGVHLTTFPPLYPSTVALAILFTSTLEGAAIAINILCMLLASSLAFLLFERVGARSILAALFTLGIFLHPSMQGVFGYAWSEGLYIVISLLLIYSLSRASEFPPTTMGMALGLLVGCAFLTRYAGITLLPVVLAGVIFIPGWPTTKRLACMGSTISVSATVIGAWVTRNYLTDGTFLGPRRASEDSLLFAIKRVISTFGELLCPADLFSPYHGWIGAAGLAALAVLAVLVARKSRWPRTLNSIFIPAITLTVAHTGLMIYSQVSTVIDPLDDRLLSPVFVPAALALAALLMHSARPISNSSLGHRFLRPTAMVAAALYLIATPALSAREIGREPLGYRFGPFDKLAIPDLCRTGAWATFTNSVDYLQFLGMVGSPHPLPRQHPYRRSERRDDWPDFISSLNKRAACIIWFGGNNTESPATEQLLGGSAEEVALTRVSSESGIVVFTARLSR